MDKTLINKKHLYISLGTALVVVVALSYSVWKGNTQISRQEMIHEQGSNVMPFRLDTTLHVFNKTENGGIESVVVRDSKNIEDLALIRMHLYMEAENFARGDFSDPSNLHGEEMPGLSVLMANFSKMRVKYSDIENGAQINFETSDNETLIALHAWFDAQVSDHGSDASTQ